MIAWLLETSLFAVAWLLLYVGLDTDADHFVLVIFGLVALLAAWDRSVTK